MVAINKEEAEVVEVQLVEARSNGALAEKDDTGRTTAVAAIIIRTRKKNAALALFVDNVNIMGTILAVIVSFVWPR